VNAIAPFVFAVIPARGGSKGIPRKNLRLLAGRPLLVHTIEAALEARRVDVVAVSTEDPEIARVARRAGAEVVERPLELATDEAPTEPALLHAVLEIEARRRRPADAVLLLQATSPLRPSRAIDDAIELLFGAGCDSVVAVREDRGAHFTGRIEAGRFVPPYDPRSRRRRQELPPLYRETGALYAVRREILFSLGCRMGGDMRALVLPEEEALDIDSLADLKLAELYLERRRLAEPRPGADAGSRS
jgi:CMP-N,N'-diacetyllegionaminic acid synthase